MDLEKSSNQISFIAGIVVTLLLAGLVAFVAFLCLRRRKSTDRNKIVIQDSFGID